MTVAIPDFAADCLRSAGRVLLEHTGRYGPVLEKESHSSVVTAADLASERIIVERLRSAFPQDGIISEEMGLVRGGTNRVWVVDPLDGTSNYAAGLPWYGVILALLEAAEPVFGAMYLPVTGTLYLCEAGSGVFRDGQRVTVTCETELRNVLCAYGMDASADQTELEQNAQLMARIVGAVRNVRTTNCLLDVCYTIDGRLGGIINHSTRIWDIAAAVLMFKEAGGLLTDIKGSRIQFPIDDTALRVEYPIVGASLELHPKLIELLNS